MVKKEASRNKSYFLVTSKDSPGWEEKTWAGPYATWESAHRAAQAWNEGVFTEVCQGHQQSPYVDVTEKQNVNQ